MKLGEASMPNFARPVQKFYGDVVGRGLRSGCLG